MNLHVLQPLDVPVLLIFWLTSWNTCWSKRLLKQANDFCKHEINDYNFFIRVIGFEFCLGRTDLYKAKILPKMCFFRFGIDERGIPLINFVFIFFIIATGFSKIRFPFITKLSESWYNIFSLVMSLIELKNRSFTLRSVKVLVPPTVSFLFLLWKSNIYLLLIHIPVRKTISKFI